MLRQAALVCIKSRAARVFARDRTPATLCLTALFIVSHDLCYFEIRLKLTPKSSAPKTKRFFVLSLQAYVSAVNSGSENIEKILLSPESKLQLVPLGPKLIKQTVNKHKTVDTEVGWAQKKKIDFLGTQADLFLIGRWVEMHPAVGWNAGNWEEENDRAWRHFRRRRSRRW